MKDIIYIGVDVVSLDICDEYREKHDYIKSMSRKNMVEFRLIQPPSKNNSHTSSIAVLCCEKIGYLGCVVDYYFYTLGNRLVDTVVFNFVTIPTNVYPIRTLISIASNLMGCHSLLGLWPG
jgi:hypothetical protein